MHALVLGRGSGLGRGERHPELAPSPGQVCRLPLQSLPFVLLRWSGWFAEAYGHVFCVRRMRSQLSRILLAGLARGRGQLMGGWFVGQGIDSQNPTPQNDPTYFPSNVILDKIRQK